MKNLPTNYHRDHSGVRYGHLIAIRYSHYKNKHSYWLCRCDCGNERTVINSDLTGGKITHCGCLNKRHRNAPHEWMGTKIYQVFRNMKSRCYNPHHPGFKDYGARGIRVCDSWLSDQFSFFKWALGNGYKEGLIIDRIDVDKDYTPENCRFVDDRTSMRNTRRTIYATINNEKKPLIEWCEQLGIAYTTVYARIYRRDTTPENAINSLLNS
jgi:hypothetical protein